MENTENSKERKNRKFGSALALLLATLLFGYAGAQSAPPPKISVSFPGGNAQTITLGQAISITAIVSNDTSGQGVTWGLRGPGALSMQTPASVEYVAPCGVTSNQTALVKATAAASPSASATFTVAVAPLP